MTFTHDATQLSWTPLGQRMGFTSEQQRDEIIRAIKCMTWAKAPTHAPVLDGPAVRAIVAAFLHRHRDQFHLVGVAQLNGGHELFGLQNARGGRSYLLDLDAEAIHVLVERPHLPAVAYSQPHVA